MDSHRWNLAQATNTLLHIRCYLTGTNVSTGAYQEAPTSTQVQKWNKKLAMLQGTLDYMIKRVNKMDKVTEGGEFENLLMDILEDITAFWKTVLP